MRIIHIIFALLILSIPVFFYKKILDTNYRLIETNASLLKQIQKLENTPSVCPPVISPEKESLSNSDE